MSVAIIDCGSGNLRSAAKAFEKVATANTGPIYVTKCPDRVIKADHIVLPGVGAFPDFKRGLNSLPGLTEALEEQVIHRGRPFLGICIGMQLMADIGYEHSPTTGLGWLGGSVSKIEQGRQSSDENLLKIPHMGWNTLSLNLPDHPFFNGIKNGSYLYFVHSFHLKLEKQENVLATTDYGGALTAIAGRDNIIGTQFHPEKSQGLGLKMIQNFLAWRP
jgi:glutamine amidotransferase